MDHLTAVVLAAQAAGMSYGKYVARQHELGRPLVPQNPKSRRKQEGEASECLCEVCGRPIPLGRRRGSKTCSGECREEHNRRRSRRVYQETQKFKPTHDWECAWCGKKFTPNRRSQRFCNVRCQEAHKRAVRRGEIEPPKLPPGMANRSYGIGECVICGERFTKRSSRAMTCSEACRKVYSGKVKKER